MKTRKVFAMMMAMVMCVCMAAAASADVTLTLGHIGPETGDAMIYGLATLRGAQIAADEITAEDNGFEIVLLHEDDTADAEKAITAYNTVLDNGAQMIVGCTTTGACIAVSAQAFEDRVFMLTPSASSTEVTANKDNMFQLCFTDPSQGTGAATLIAEKQLGTKIAVIYNNQDEYSTGIYKTFAEKAAELNLEIVSTTTFTKETTDYSVQVADAQNNGADLVFLPMYYGPASQILIAADSIGYKPVFFGVDGMDGILTLEGFDTSLAEGVMLMTPFAPDAQDELTVNFVAKYNELYGEVPTQFAADAYDCVYALFEAAKIAGVETGAAPEDVCDAMIDAIQQIEITGLTGTMKWSANGEVEKVPAVVVIKDSGYVSLDN